MEENRKHIDKLFREELGNYTETPSPAVWEALEKRLDTHYAQEVKTPVRSYSWVWYALAAAIVAMVLYFVLSGAVKRSHSESPAINKGTGYTGNTTPSAQPSSAAIQDHELANEDHTNERATKTENNADNNTGETSSAGKSGAASVGSTQNPGQGKAAVNASAKAAHTSAANHHSTTSNKQAGQNNAQVPVSNVAVHSRKVKKSSPDGNNSSVAANNNNNAGIRNDKKDTQHNTSESSASAIVEKGKTSAEATASTGKTAKDVKSTASATNNNPVSKTPASKKATGSKNTSSKKDVKGETGLNATGETAATANNTVAKPTKNIPGAKSLTENTYSGGNAATANKPSKKTGNNGAPKKTGAAADKLANNNTTAKKNSKPANRMKDKAQEPDQGPDVSFDNTAGNKSKKEPEIAKAEEKPKIDWQKGFKADDDRGIKKVSAGNESGNAGKDAGTQDGGDKVAQSGGGGGAAAGYGEKEKKKKKDKTETGKKPFDFGAKLGFEKGFGSYQANKLVFAPYLQFKIASNISVVAQPTVKYAMINKNVLDDPQSYYRTGSSSLDSNHTIKKAVDSFAEDTITRRYYLHQSHDSIVVTRSIKQKSYIEFELPVLLQFKVSKSFSPYLGVTMSYSTIVNSADDQKTYSGITRNDSVIYAPVPKSAPAPATPNPGSSFQYNGTPFSQYTPGPSSAPSSMFRFSYSVGFNYLVNNRLFFDLMYTKTFSSLTGIQDTRIREIYNQGYLRLSVGYRFGK